MKNNIIKNVKLIKMATVAVFFVAMAFNVAMVTSSPNAGETGLSLSSLKAMVFANGEHGSRCFGDHDCPYNQICISPLQGMAGHCSGGGMCQSNSDCTSPQICNAGLCTGGQSCFDGCSQNQICDGERCVNVGCSAQCQLPYHCNIFGNCVW